ncbi:MAG: DapH/DapD/GlmU-related protein, partial [Anaerolineae bacterium]|nr:DapH/DapD/GlmU-related protein [Anaerolineae bacterium]
EDVPIRLQGESRQGIVIEDNCWIGGHAVILDGVRIGSGSVIGAGSVITKDIPANSFVVGNPARVIRERTSCDGHRLTENEGDQLISANGDTAIRMRTS